MNVLHKLLVLFFLLQFTSSFAQKGFKQRGKASYYADKFHGRQTANGERFDMYDFTAAHRTLPFGTKVRVTNLKNNKSVVVRVNDRGPFSKGRIIDLSMAAAKKIDMVADGIADVKIEKVGSKDNSRSGAEKEHRKPAKRISHGKYYNHSFRSISPSGFGVQIASYSQKQLAQQKAKAYQVKYSISMVIEKSKKGYYRLIMGKYRKRKKAERLQKQMKRKFKGCFVIEY